MAMTFTIASAARDALGEVIRSRLKRQKAEEDRRAAAYEEASPPSPIYLRVELSDSRPRR